jgi:hypothetical protein
MRHLPLQRHRYASTRYVCVCVCVHKTYPESSAWRLAIGDWRYSNMCRHCGAVGEETRYGPWPTDEYETMLIKCCNCSKHFHPITCLELTPKTLSRIYQLHNGVDVRPRMLEIPQYYEPPTCKPLDFKFNYTNPPKNSIPWRCSDCKVCVTCETAGKEDRLLFCDCCDRGYHTYCLTKALIKPPMGMCQRLAIESVNL